MKNPLLLGLVLVSLSSCNPDPDPTPLSAVARASIGIKNDVLSLHSILKEARDATSNPAEKLSIEIEMSVLASSVWFTLGDLMSGVGTDAANLGRLDAVEAELELLQSPEIQKLHPVDVSAILEKVNQAKALISGSPISDWTINSGWRKFLQNEQIESTKKQNAIETLNAAVVQSAGTGIAGIQSMVAPLAVLQELNSGYLDLGTKILNAGTIANSGWAKLKATALRQDIMTQLAAEWYTAAPLNEVIPNGPKQEGSCIKASHGDNAGVSNGTVSSSTAANAASTVFSPCTMSVEPTSPIPLLTPPK